MKIYGYQNKGGLLLEHIISIMIILIFINLLTISLNIFKNNRNIINRDIERIRIIKMLNKISEKITISNKKNIKNNSIYLDDIVFKFRKKALYSYKIHGTRGSKIFNYDKFLLEKYKDNIIIIINIKEKKIIKWVYIL